MKGQVTIPLVLWVVMLLFVFVPLLPVINASISSGVEYMNPGAKSVAYMIPFMILLAIILIPFNMNRIWNFAFGDDRGGSSRRERY